MKVAHLRAVLPVKQNVVLKAHAAVTYTVRSEQRAVSILLPCNRCGPVSSMRNECLPRIIRKQLLRNKEMFYACVCGAPAPTSVRWLKVTLRCNPCRRVVAFTRNQQDTYIKSRHKLAGRCIEAIVKVIFEMRACRLHHVLCVVSTALFVGVATAQCLTKQQFSAYKDNHQYSTANVKKDWSNPTGFRLHSKDGHLLIQQSNLRPNHVSGGQIVRGLVFSWTIEECAL